MAYIPTEWETGDVITAVKLNKLENGVAAIDGVMVVLAEEEGDTATLTATYAEIAAAMTAGIPVFIKYQISESENTLQPVFANGVIAGDTSQYQIAAYDLSTAAEVDYIADAADGYPSYTYQ